MQYTDEKPADPVTLFIYTGRDCAFTLYEDEGTNYNYEKGACSTIKFSYNNKTGELVIGRRIGEYDGMLESRTFNVVWIDNEDPVAFDPEILPHATLLYNERVLSLPERIKIKIELPLKKVY